MKYDDEVLGMYLKEINKIPLLSREEENELAVKAKNGDKIAKNKIDTYQKLRYNLIEIVSLC